MGTQDGERTNQRVPAIRHSARLALDNGRDTARVRGEAEGATRSTP